VVARLAGRMEYGARALGNRSILANPNNPDTVRVINEQMKNRDFWMPFAGTLLAERADDYLENPKHLPSPYMMLAFKTKPLAHKEMRAAMHPYDFTMRPQILEQNHNPAYYRLIKAFEKYTGIGGVLNTSFNLHGFPIVLGPSEAYHAFQNSGLQYLALENHLISKI
jgi:carbamoyltransferase